MDGPEISLYENTKTGQRIVNPTLVYGDEMLQTLHTLYDKGARDFVHLGTAGGLKEGLNMGDILLPNRFIKKDGTVELFANDALKLDLGSRLKDRVLSHSTQAWIPTIIEETKSRLKALQAQGADAVDVESLYISEFFQKHPDCRKSVIIMISDNPFGTHSYSDENVTRGIPIKGVHQILPILLNPLPHSKL